MIDATGYQSLKEIIKSYKAKGIKVIISGINEDTRKNFEMNEMFTVLDKEYIFKNILEALEKVKSINSPK